MAMRVVGYDEETGTLHDIGAAAPAPPKLALRPAAKPAAPALPPVDWRQKRAANGVFDAQENMVPLPFVPDANGGVFVPGGPTLINWIGKPQRPYRAERLLVNVAPVVVSTPGLAGTRALCLGPFVGSDFQPTARGQIDLGFYTANAFGVRFALTAAEPGIEIAFPVNLSVYPGATGESVFISLQMNGANIA